MVVTRRKNSMTIYARQLLLSYLLNKEKQDYTLLLEPNKTILQ